MVKLKIELQTNIVTICYCLTLILYKRQKILERQKLYAR